MHLTLSSRHPRGSLYSTDAGQILYKVDKSGFSATALRRAVNNGEFALYAEVAFHKFKSARFRFNNDDVSVDEYLHKEGRFDPKWVFRAADGGEYYWKLDRSQLEMFRNDGKQQGVVKFQEYKSSFGPFIKGRPASLEVDDACVPILDEIIMTFIYCQKQRKKRWQANGGASYDAALNSAICRGTTF